jgi:hypothetical protein
MKEENENVIPKSLVERLAEKNGGTFLSKPNSVEVIVPKRFTPLSLPNF